MFLNLTVVASGTFDQRNWRVVRILLYLFIYLFPAFCIFLAGSRVFGSPLYFLTWQTHIRLRTFLIAVWLVSMTVSTSTYHMRPSLFDNNANFFSFLLVSQIVLIDFILLVDLFFIIYYVKNCFIYYHNIIWENLK